MASSTTGRRSVKLSTWATRVRSSPSTTAATVSGCVRATASTSGASSPVRSPEDRKPDHDDRTAAAHRGQPGDVPRRRRHPCLGRRPCRCRGAPRRRGEYRVRRPAHIPAAGVDGENACRDRHPLGRSGRGSLSGRRPARRGRRQYPGEGCPSRRAGIRASGPSSTGSSSAGSPTTPARWRGSHRRPHQRPEPRRITHVEQGALMDANPIPVKKTAVVTGAGSTAGIGRTVALTLAEGGWHVALIDNNAEGLTEVEKDLVDSGHENVLAIPTDITSTDSVAAAFAAIDEKLPPVVALVNLAGIACPVALHEVELEEFERVMAVNVTGSYLMLKAAAERMIPRGVGRIVNTSSITAFDGGGTFSKGVYATAEAAVIGMCRGGARELGPFGITVNVVAPGPIDTQIMGGKLTDERKASMSSTIPLGRDLLGLADAAERNGRGHGRLAFVGELAAHDLGVDRPGSQDVDGDAEGTQFSRTATAHADERCLGCRINTLG